MQLASGSLQDLKRLLKIAYKKKNGSLIVSQAALCRRFATPTRVYSKKSIANDLFLRCGLILVVRQVYDDPKQPSLDALLLCHGRTRTRACGSRRRAKEGSDSSAGRGDYVVRYGSLTMIKGQTTDH
jgi:hypothetical protein